MTPRTQMKFMWIQVKENKEFTDLIDRNLFLEFSHVALWGLSSDIEIDSLFYIFLFIIHNLEWEYLSPDLLFQNAVSQSLCLGQILREDLRHAESLFTDSTPTSKVLQKWPKRDLWCVPFTCEVGSGKVRRCPRWDECKAFVILKIKFDDRRAVKQWPLHYTLYFSDVNHSH